MIRHRSVISPPALKVQAASPRNAAKLAIEQVAEQQGRGLMLGELTQVATPQQHEENAGFVTLTSTIEISDVIHGSRDWVGMFSRGER